MVNKFTQKAQAALSAALKTAEELGHSYIGTEHLLLGLITQKESIASRILTLKGVSEARLKKKISEHVGVGTTREISGSDMTPRLHFIIEAASLEARKNGVKYVGTEHLLAALLSRRDCVAIRLLESDGISVPELKAELSAEKDKHLRLMAEYDNFRKRSARDISDARSHAVADTLTPFLAVSDFLGMAQVAAEKSDNLDAIKQGLLMIIAQFDKALEEMSVRKFSAVGEKFDPALHDAVGREPSDTIPEGVIIREWNCGYKIGEKLLRPARVMVSSGAVPAEENKE